MALEEMGALSKKVVGKAKVYSPLGEIHVLTTFNQIATQENMSLDIWKKQREEIRFSIQQNKFTPVRIEVPSIFGHLYSKGENVETGGVVFKRQTTKSEERLEVLLASSEKRGLRRWRKNNVCRK